MKEDNLSEAECYLKYYDKIFRDTNAQSSIRTRVMESTKNQGNFFSIDYTPVSGRNKNQVTTLYYKGNNCDLIAWLSDICVKRKNKLVKLEKLGTFWDGFPLNNLNKEGNIDFSNGKKPEALLQKILNLTTEKEDLILDFHLGSGSTGAVAHKMNRQYIGIEQMDYIENVTVERLKKVIIGEQGGISKSVNWQGGGSFTYLELKKYNQIFIDKILEAKDSETLFGIWEEMKKKSFLNYNIAIQKQEEYIDDFKRLDFSAQQELLIALLDKNQLYVNLSSLEDKDFGCTAEELKVTQDFYQLKK